MIMHRITDQIKSIISICVMALTVIMVLTGCGADADNSSDSASHSAESVSIGFSQLGAESDWRSSNSMSMRSTFTRDKGYDLIFKDGQQKQSNQITAIRSFIQQGVDYIVLAPVTQDGWDTVLGEAKDAGIPVIIVDRMVEVSDDSLFSCWVGSDFHLEGLKACEWLRQYTTAQGIAPSDLHIVDIQGTIGSSAQIGRTAGLEEYATRYGWDLREETSGDFTQAKGREVMAQMLVTYNNINVVYCENDNEALGAIEAIEAAGKHAGGDIRNGDILVISFDGVNETAFEYCMDGTIACIVECNPLHGPRVENIIKTLESGGTPNKLEYVNEDIFTSHTTVQVLDIDGKSYPVKIFSNGSSEPEVISDNKDAEGEPAEKGDDLVYEPDSLGALTMKYSIGDMLDSYAVNMIENGKYADYQGDIGEIVEAYKNVDLNGDGRSDRIIRSGKGYSFEFSDGTGFKTDDHSASPNEGEIIEFIDLNEDNIDEILIAHYTFGTGGPVIWDTAIYSYVDGDWKAFPIIDREGKVYSFELTEYISERTGKPYEDGSVRFASVSIDEAGNGIDLLVDFGYKDGPSQVYDYEDCVLFSNFDPDFSNYTLLSHGADEIINIWPLEISGESVSVSADDQYAVNLFMSNFSEQGFGDYYGWNADMLAHFAMEWMKANKVNELDCSHEVYAMTHSDINRLVQKYFNTNLEESDFYSLGEYNDYFGSLKQFDGETYYCEPVSDGEMYRNNGFSVVSDMQKLKTDHGDTYRLEFAVYRLDTDIYDEKGIGKEQYSLNAEMAASKADANTLYKAYEGMAIVDRSGDGSFSMRYYRTYDE